MISSNKIGIIGESQDIGASRRGVDMGPSAIRIAGLRKRLTDIGYTVIDYGNIQTSDRDNYEFSNITENPKLRHIDPIVASCMQLKTVIKKIFTDGCFPLVLGGDHSISIGVLAGLKDIYHGQLGVIWADANAGFNTPETTPSGNIHGMPLAVIIGRGDTRLTGIGPSPTVIEENTVLIGTRDIDPGEALNLKTSKVSIFTTRDIDEHGMFSVAKEAIAWASTNINHFHVTFDIGVIDPMEAPGTGTKVDGGLTYREALLLMQLIHESGKMVSLEIVEVNPALDVENKSSKIAVELIATALGETIL